MPQHTFNLNEIKQLNSKLVPGNIIQVKEDIQLERDQGRWYYYRKMKPGFWKIKNIVSGEWRDLTPTKPNYNEARYNFIKCTKTGIEYSEQQAILIPRLHECEDKYTLISDSTDASVKKKKRTENITPGHWNKIFSAAGVGGNFRFTGRGACKLEITGKPLKLGDKEIDCRNTIVVETVAEGRVETFTKIILGYAEITEEELENLILLESVK
jgi:hypothetical protein